MTSSEGLHQLENAVSVVNSRIGHIRNAITSINIPRLAMDLFILSLKLGGSIFVSAYRMIFPPPMKTMIDETVLITGAGHGIGRELAIQLAALGSIVVCWDTNFEALQSTTRKISENGGEAYGFVVDVSNKEDVRKVAQIMTQRNVPKITILINNAAILLHNLLLFHSAEDITKTFEVNVLSNFWTIQTFLPNMIEENRGHIVSISSMCGLYGIPYKVPYCASKFAVTGLMDALSEELRLSFRQPDIKFTTIYPFFVDTGLAKDPRYKFPYIFGVVTPQYAAQQVIIAIRRNYTNYSIPRCLFFLNVVLRILPERSKRLLLDFLANVKK